MSGNTPKMSNQHYNLTPSDIARPTKEELSKYAAHINFPWQTPPVRVPLPFPVESAIAHYKKTYMLQNSPNGSYLVWSPSELQDNDAQEYLHTYAIMSSGEIDPSSKHLIMKTNDLSNYADSCRIVSAGLKITYVGRQDEQSGFFMSLVSQGATKNLQFSELDPAIEVSFLLQDDNTQISPVQDGLCAKWRPTDYDDLNFKTSKGTHDFEVGIAIQGSENFAPFLIETIQTVEYIPSVNVGFVIPGSRIQESNHSSEIMSTASKLPSKTTTKKDDDNWWNTVKNAVGTASEVLDTAGEIWGKLGPIVEIGASLL